MAEQSIKNEEIALRVMRLLKAQPDMSQRELADQVGISLGAVNYCLKALMDKGFVKLENFHNSQHKFKYVYILTPAGMAQKLAMTGRFLKQKLEEYEALKKEIVTLQEEAAHIQDETHQIHEYK